MANTWSFYTAAGGLITSNTATNISILDVGGDFTATNVEDALAELQTDNETQDALRAGFRPTLNPTDTGTVNNWNPAGFANGVFIQWEGTSNLTLTGLTALADGSTVALVPANGAFTITLKHEDTNSTATNRFFFQDLGNVSYTIGMFELVTLVYRSNRWAVLGIRGSSYASTWKLN